METEEKKVYKVDDIIDAWYHDKRVSKITIGLDGKSTEDFLERGAAVYDVGPKSNFYYRVTDQRYAILLAYNVDQCLAYVRGYWDGKCDFTIKSSQANIFSRREEAEAVLSHLKIKDFLKVIEI